MEFIDLDEKETESEQEEYSSRQEEEYEEKPAGRRRIPFHMIMHLCFLLFLIGGVAILVHKFSNWGKYVDLNELALQGEGRDDYNMDDILPLFTETEGLPCDDGVTTILAFGNSPLSDNRDSENSLANLIADKAGAYVYNCAVSGSCMAADRASFSANKAPMDAYSFYWLVTLAVTGANTGQYESAEAAMGSELPPEAKEVYQTLTTIDLNTVDVVMICYDGTDYLKARSMYDDNNRTDITCFTGNMEAGIELLQDNYPHIRIIVMSPPYAYAVDEKGDYVSSDMYTYGEDVLSTYAIKQAQSAAYRSVSYVDNIYGSINEDNAKDYLVDNIHLNQKGRELLAERFVNALTYYDTTE